MGDGVDLQSKLMPSVSEERPHELAGADFAAGEITMEQCTLFPIQR